MNFASLKKSLGQAVKSAANTVSDLSTEVVGAKCLREVTLQAQTATSGLWKIHTGRSKKYGPQNPVVAVWILDKRSLANDASRGKVWEPFLEICRKDAAHLTRLRHPGILRLLEPMEETRTQIVMVTEAIFASAADLLHKFEGLPGSVADKRQGTKLSELEIKHGLMQVAEALQFMHAEANLIHRALCPDAVMLTASGAWKIAGLGFAAMAEFNAAHPENLPFGYEDPRPPLWLKYTRPQLAYVAPELTAGAASSGPVAPTADIFSLGALAYELTTGSQLLPVGDDVAAYRGRLASLHMMDWSAVPAQLQAMLRPMLATVPSTRPPAIAFTGSQYFQDDVLLRALRFMDTMLQRDSLQKAAFLKDLATFWERFDQRILRYKVLPPLLVEVRNEALQAVVLPLVLRIVQHQDKQDFADFTLPALQPICESAKADTLLLLVQSSEVLAGLLSPDATATVLLPLLVRAAEIGDSRIQEEMLKKIPALALQLGYDPVRAELMPRIYKLCLGTTSAGVRVAALQSMRGLVARMNREEATKMLQCAAQVTSVDKTAPTVMCVVNMGDTIAKQWGVDCAAAEVLPVTGPLLVAPSLSHPQFSAALRLTREILNRIEARRSGEAGDAAALAAQAGQAGMPAASGKAQPPAVNGWDTGPKPAAPPPLGSSNGAPTLAPSLPPWTHSSGPPSSSPSAGASATSSQQPRPLGGMTPMQPTSSQPLGAPTMMSSLGGGGFSASTMASTSGRPVPSSGVGRDPFALQPGPMVPAAPNQAGDDIFGDFSGTGGSGFMGGGTVPKWDPSPQGQAGSVDDIFKDPSWRDPSLPPLPGAASRSPSEGFGAAVAAAALDDPFSMMASSRPSTGAPPPPTAAGSTRRQGQRPPVVKPIGGPAPAASNPMAFSLSPQLGSSKPAPAASAAMQKLGPGDSLI